MYKTVFVGYITTFGKVLNGKPDGIFKLIKVQQINKIYLFTK